MKSRLVVLMLLSALLVGACGDASTSVGGLNPDTPTSGAPDSPVSSTPDPHATPEPGRPQRVYERDGLVDVMPRIWDKAKQTGPRSLDLVFYSGVEECYGVDHIEVDYGNDSITVTLFEGRVETAETCIEIAVQKVIAVELDQPIRGRAIHDGAPPQ
ncbi:MAG TPA: hypothetical protein VNC78_09145 [Actinomycetota bacterium]|nr:hypothetical protein [Actinomycetota bacterium]